MKAQIKQVIRKSRVPTLISSLLPDCLIILRYHSIQESPQSFSHSIGKGIIHSASLFDAQMAELRSRFSVVDLDDLLEFASGARTMPKRAVAVTFDDGFLDNDEIAAPILARHGIRAAFYVTTGTIDGNQPPWYCRLRNAFDLTTVTAWCDPFTRKVLPLQSDHDRNEARRFAGRSLARLVMRELEDYVAQIEGELGVQPLIDKGKLMMNWDQVRGLSLNHIIGSHTVSHPNMNYLRLDEALRELADSKMILEQQLGKPVVHFSYPSPIMQPHWSADTCDLTMRVGYRTAVTSTSGVWRYSKTLLSLPRLAVPESTDELLWQLETCFRYR